MKHTCIMNKMRSAINNVYFISFHQLVDYTYTWIKYLPHDVDVIVGIPRSGLFVASIISLSMGKPLSTPNSLPSTYWSCKKESPKRNFVVDGETLLLVDDSVGSGKTFDEAEQKIRNILPNSKVLKASLFTYNSYKNKLDYYFVVSPRGYTRFEWGLMHSHLGITATDMDGILCDEKGNPYRIPAYTLDMIITSRPESERKTTEEWLKKHNVKYKTLFMWNKRKYDDAVSFKIRTLFQLRPDWFWESDYPIAVELHKRTGLPILAFDRMELIK